jgi:hypothetical protein
MTNSVMVVFSMVMEFEASRPFHIIGKMVRVCSGDKW